MFDDETPIAWTALPQGIQVVASDGADIGKVEDVLGDREDDIFHGLLVRRAADGERVELPATHVKKMTAHHVVTDLDAGQAGTLQAYRRR
jgi:sporulation protein YlmC with PRC-barrel domain